MGDELVLDEQTKDLLLRQKRAEALKAIRDAEEATKKVGQPEVPETIAKPLEGKVETDSKAGFLADLVAYAAMEKGVDGVARAVKDLGTTKVFIVEDRNLIASNWHYELVRGQLLHHESELRAAANLLGMPSAESPEKLSMLSGTPQVASVAALAAGATSLVGSLADLVGMFRIDHSIKGRDVTIDQASVTAETAGRLVVHGIEVVLDAFALIKDSKIIQKLNALRSQSAEVHRALMQFDEARVAPQKRLVDEYTAAITVLEAQVLKAAGEATPTDDLVERIDAMREQRLDKEKESAKADAAVRIAQTIIEAADTFQTAVCTPIGTSYPPIVAAAVRERLYNDGQTDGGSGRPSQVTHVLYIALTHSGSEIITRRGHFVRSGTIGLVGGCNLAYLLLDVTADKVTGGGSTAWVGHGRYKVGKDPSKLEILSTEQLK